MKKYTGTVLIILVLALIGGAIYYVLTQKSVQNTNSNQTQYTSVEYKNTQYGFSFTLPLSWKDYFIVADKWEGVRLDMQDNNKIQGPEIIIRHPLWTIANPRQDIPIMIFTTTQWGLIKQEKLSVGAAPVPPSELGRNATYVMALPARYNYAFLPGFEEVETILQGSPLKAF